MGRFAQRKKELKMITQVTRVASVLVGLLSQVVLIGMFVGA
jgi:tetrahydromethanopterin S-methyltransferase subunit F